MIKRKRNNLVTIAPTTCHIFTFVLLFLQTINPIGSQTFFEPNDDNHLSAGVPQVNNDIQLSSTQDDLVCPHCNRLREMPMELADKINQVNDVDIFIHDFVDDSMSLSNTTTLSQHPASRKRRAAREQLRQATCQPVDTIVSLVPPDEKDPTVFYFPSCILIKQCGGCCAHTGTTCSPTEETDKQVTIKKTKFTGGTKLQAMGEVTVNVKEHNRCRCQCKKTASDCNSLQRFIANQCRCECTNIQEAEDCATNPTKLWDIKSCACVCRDEKDCPSGLQYDQSTCSCQPITDDGDDLLDFGDHTYNETFEATEVTKYDTLAGAAEQ